MLKPKKSPEIGFISFKSEQESGHLKKLPSQTFPYSWSKLCLDFKLALWWILDWYCCVVVITTAQLHSTKSELRFCAGSNSACGVSRIWDGEDLWQGFLLKIRLNAFCQSTIPLKQFIIIIIFISFVFLKNMLICTSLWRFLVKVKTFLLTNQQYFWNDI